MTVANVLFVVIGTAIAWWISGYDARVTGENPKEDFVRRATRTGISLVLLTVATLNGFAAIFIFVSLGLYWAGCGAEFFSHQIHQLIDAEDKREFDPKETERKLDRLAKLIREGRTEEALDMCGKLEASGEASPVALEAMVHRLYQETLNAAGTSPFLEEVRGFCEQRQFDQAESHLKRILSGQPKNWAAMLLLIRLYAEGLHQPGKAFALLQPANQPPQLHPAFIKYARQSIGDWSAAAKNGETMVPPADSSQLTPHPSAISPSTTVVAEISVDELLKNNQLATAIEYLEKAIAGEPRNFDLWLKLAEAHGVYCADLNRAAKIIQKMENSAAFTPPEIELAKARLKEWRAGRRA
jgi:tetratricopeptide (TPR) repeat protein